MEFFLFFFSTFPGSQKVFIMVKCRSTQPNDVASVLIISMILWEILEATDAQGGASQEVLGIE